MGHAYMKYFSKTYVVYNRMMQQKNVSFPGKTPLKLKNTPKSNNFSSVPDASTAGPCVNILSLLLRVY